MKNDEPLAICSIRDESRKGTILLYYGMTKEVVQRIHSIIRTKGPLISKCLFGVFNFLKKRMKTIRLEVP